MGRNQRLGIIRKERSPVGLHLVALDTKGGLARLFDGGDQTDPRKDNWHSNGRQEEQDPSTGDLREV